MDNENFQELVLEQLKALVEGQKALHEGQARLETRTGNLEQGQSALIERVGNLEEGQVPIRRDVQLLQKGQSRIETRLENEVVEKIRALFDDRSMTQDYFISIKDSLARIEENTEVLIHRTIEHGRRLDNHDRELRLLRAESK